MTKTKVNNVQGSKLAPLITELRGLIQSARHAVATTVNSLQVLTNFEIGRRIVEYEQNGAERAEYGKELLKALSLRLSEEFGKGFSERNLRSFRALYLTYQDRSEAIWQKPSAKLSDPAIQQKPSVKLPLTPIYQKPSGKLINHEIVQRPSAQSGKSPFTLSWSHYVLLLTIKKPDERSFYEIEATHEGWSLPELKRQVASCLYERLALSKDKENVRRLADEGQVIVELTLPADANIHAREYNLYLPSKELLQQKLVDWVREQEVAYGAGNFLREDHF